MKYLNATYQVFTSLHFYSVSVDSSRNTKTSYEKSTAALQYLTGTGASWVKILTARPCGAEKITSLVATAWENRRAFKLDLFAPKFIRLAMEGALSGTSPGRFRVRSKLLVCLRCSLTGSRIRSLVFASILTGLCAVSLEGQYVLTPLSVHRSFRFTLTSLINC